MTAAFEEVCSKAEVEEAPTNLNAKFEAQHLATLQAAPTLELQEIASRCERLLSLPSIANKLPKEKVLEMRWRKAMCESLISSRGADSSKLLSSSQHAPSANAPTPSAMSSSGVDQAVIDEITEKYRHYRPDFEGLLRGSLGTLLSSRELDNRLREIPNPATYMMTLDETITMEKEMYERERRRELQRLRERVMRQQQLQSRSEQN